MDSQPVRERPILFSGPMVRAILDGRKTQTRRVVTAQPPKDATFAGYLAAGANETGFYWCDGDPRDIDGWTILNAPMFRCPYGVPGDRLWVLLGIDDWRGAIRFEADGSERFVYQCDAPEDVGMWPGSRIRKYEGRKRPAIFMPRWASRITLEITDVRVQRIQDISEEDAAAEGARDASVHGDWDRSYRKGFSQLWDSINAKRGFGWEINPWVWGLSFKRLQ